MKAIHHFPRSRGHARGQAPLRRGEVGCYLDGTPLGGVSDSQSGDFRRPSRGILVEFSAGQLALADLPIDFQSPSGQNEDWVWFFEGGRSGSRYFKRGGSGEVISEQQLRAD